MNRKRKTIANEYVKLENFDKFPIQERRRLSHEQKQVIINSSELRSLFKPKKHPPLKKITTPKGMSASELKKYITSNARLALDEFVRHLSSEIEMAYREAVSFFYDDYMPSVYKRTFSTYQASSNWQNPDRYENQGDIFVSGITISSDNIKGQPYFNHWGKNKGRPMDTDWVFQRTFTEGIHGITKNDIKKMNKKWVRQFKKGGKTKIIRRGNTKAKIKINAPRRSGYFSFYNNYVGQSRSFVEMENDSKHESSVSYLDSLNFSPITFRVSRSPEQVFIKQFEKLSTKKQLMLFAQQAFARRGFNMYS